MLQGERIGPAAWLFRLRADGRWNFLGLLVVIGAMFVVYPALHDLPAGPVAFALIRLVIFLACCRVIFRGRGNAVAAVVLGGPLFASGLIALVIPEPTRGFVVSVGHGFGALFIGFTVVVILQMIYRGHEVSLDGVFGAICGYVLLAIAFAHAYAVMEAVAPGSFKTAEGVPEGIWDPGRADFEFDLYSLLTLTTVGSDVLTPVTRTARAIAAIEGVSGQFYMAIIVADLVGKRMSQVLTEQPSRPATRDSATDTGQRGEPRPEQCLP